MRTETKIYEQKIILGTILFATMFLLCLLSVRPCIAFAQTQETEIDFGFVYDSQQGGYVVQTYTGDENVVVVPETYLDMPVTGIGYCFQGKDIVEITLPKSVTNIPEWAFMDCDLLQKVRICGDIRLLPQGVFYGCASLKEVILPQSLKQVGAYAFSDCASLESVRWPDSIEYFDQDAFWGWSGLKEITIPKSVKKLESWMFSNTSLEKAVIYSKQVEDYTFADCKTLREISVSTQKIGKYVFLNCTNLRKVNLQSPVKKIETYAFYGCTSLKTISLPSSVKKLESYAFYGCKNLFQVIVTSNLSSIGKYALYGCPQDRVTIVAPQKSYAADFARHHGIGTSSSSKLSGNKLVRTVLAPGKSYPRVYNASEKIKWSSSSRTVASVNQKGGVTFRKAGKVRITARVGKKKIVWKFNVKSRSSKVALSTICKYYVTKDMTDKEKVEAANRWLVENVTYDTRYYRRKIPNVSHTANGALVKGVAVCDGYASSFLKIMKHYGIPCKLITGRAGKVGHAWNLVKIGSKWYHVDATWNDPDDKYGTVDDEYLLVTDSEMKKSRKWKTSAYPKANSKKVNSQITHTGIYGAVLNRRTATVKVGQTTFFKVSGTKKKIKYKSSNTDVATVNSKGKVKAKRAGTAKIKVLIGGKSYNCVVTVKPAKT